MVLKEKINELIGKEVRFVVSDIEVNFNHLRLDPDGKIIVEIKLDAVGNVESVIDRIKELQKLIDELGYEVFNSEWEVIFRFLGLRDDKDGYFVVDSKEFNEFLAWKRGELDEKQNKSE